jgi:hypothetical protein
VGTRLGCNIGGIVINALAYADDVVMLAPAWRAIQRLLDILFDESSLIDMQCNVDKTVCMVFPPKTGSCILLLIFPR